MRIFVSVCSHRDPLLSHTVRDLFEKSSTLHDITCGIFDQSHIDEALCTTHPELAYHQNVIYKRIDPEYSDGVAWARHINMINVTDEYDMFYQIDSHIVFDGGWDHMLMRDYNMAAEISGSDKVIITGSCKVFEYDADTDTIKRLNDFDPITTKVGYYKMIAPGCIPCAHGDVVPATQVPEKGFHILAGNFFTHAAWIKNVGLNPQLYFDTEEVMMSLESWVAGYTIYHNTITPSYHLDGTMQWPSKQYINPVVEFDKLEKDSQRSIDIFVKYITNLDKNLLEKYREEFGIDYINFKIEDRARTYTHPDDSEYDSTIPHAAPVLI